ncbi:Imm1 family immunity protein [Saccharothrix sp. NRRL B-16348]|uniref:Imm1 family immunity protein n=1 Tax=Saccharothrix sp. NRRL B-16348 TaxID=1415542 RepID=UPI0018D1A310|nr:Imm1 family immunity protein [Saccharothrix sp. NRRL B-16348]
MSDNLEARDADERQSLVDLALERHDERWNIVLQFEPDSNRAARPVPHGRHEHLLVGIHGDRGAAVLHKFKDPAIGDFVITATVGEHQSKTPSPVPLDDSAGMYFLTDRLIPKNVLRSAIIEYALTGSVSKSVTMTPFDWHRDHYQVEFPDELPTGHRWPTPGETFTGEPPF